MIESCGSSLGKQLIILYFPPFLSVSTTANSTYLPIPSIKSLTSVLIISSFSFSIIRDFPPQLINAFSLVTKKYLFRTKSTTAIIKPVNQIRKGRQKK